VWLPTDERRLLAGYFTHIGEVGETKAYKVRELRKLLARTPPAKLWEYDDNDSPPDNDTGENNQDFIKRYFAETKRFELANKHLAERKLITLSKHESEDVQIVGLTIEGYDLGRKYANIWTRSGEWFQEYQSHWLWLILATVGGGVVAKLIDWLFAMLTTKPS
jgi:hypothetical protein